MNKSSVLISFFVLLALHVNAEEIYWRQVISSTDTWTYTVPQEQPESFWTSITFEDASWQSGKGGIGYGNSDCVTILPDGTLSVLVRKEFVISNPSQLLSAQLNIIYDDGFVAYLNGVEIARANLNGNPPAWNQESASYHEEESEISPFLIDSDILSQSIRQGNNVLAIEVHNQSNTSSDLSCSPYLFMGFDEAREDFSETPSWFVPIEKEEVIDSNELTNYKLVSNLPIIVINTNGNPIADEPKTEGQMGVIYTPGVENSTLQDYNHFLNPVGIELRGSSSLGFPKKTYSLEFHDVFGEDTSLSIFDMPKEEDWVLQGPYTDKSLIRNALAYHLGREMDRWAPRTQVCELIINDEYKGLYVFMEKIKRDKNRVDISKLKPEDISEEEITGGYILKIDKDRSEPGFDSQYEAMGDYYHPDYPIRFLYHYPKPDNLVAAQQEYIQEYVEAFEEALMSKTYKDTAKGYSHYINTASFVDFLIAMEVSKNIDGYRISTYLHKDKNEKLTMGPLWDFNFAFGMSKHYNSYSSEGWNFEMYEHWTWEDYQMPFWWERLLDDVDFRHKLGRRWVELRQDRFSTVSLMAYIDDLTTEINGAQIRNFQQWPILGLDIDPNKYTFDTYTEEVDYIKDWLAERLDWLDDNMPEVPTYLNALKVAKAVNIYPNPFINDLNIDVQLCPGDKVSLTLYDALNHVCASYHLPHVLDHNLHINWENLRPSGEPMISGIYFLKVEINNTHHTYKIIKL